MWELFSLRRDECEKRLKRTWPQPITSRQFCSNFHFAVFEIHRVIGVQTSAHNGVVYIGCRSGFVATPIWTIRTTETKWKFLILCAFSGQIASAIFLPARRERHAAVYWVGAIGIGGQRWSDKQAAIFCIRIVWTGSVHFEFCILLKIHKSKN